MSGAQSPSVRLRSNRIVGYQGVVSLSRFHRQSEQQGSSVQTGRPIAPARCTVELSTEEDKIESGKPGGEIVEIDEGIAFAAVVEGDAEAIANCRGLGGTGAVLQIDKADARNLKHGLPEFERNRALVLRFGVLPSAQEMPTLSPPSRAKPSRHLATDSGLGAR